jgi:NADH-ubiquinone oxidoreductase chain 2
LEEIHGMCKHCPMVVFHILLCNLQSLFEQCKSFFVNFCIRRFVKIMYFDTPKTWILYKPMDRKKSLLLAITLFFITFFFLYPSPLPCCPLIYFVNLIFPF